MVCKNCGEQLRNEAVFCVNCGTKVDVTAPDVTEADSQTNVELADEVAYGADAATVTPIVPKKKSSKKIWITLTAILVFVAMTGTLFLTSFAYIKNAFYKTFFSSEDYFAFVMNSNAEDLAGNVAASLVKNKDLYAEGISGSSNISIELNEEFYDTLEDIVGDEIGTDAIELFSWLEKISFGTQTNIDDKKTQVVFDVKANDVELGKLDIIQDAEDYTLYLGLGDYNSDYLRWSSYYGGMTAPDSLTKLIASLPDEAAAEKLLLKYIDVVAKSVDDVKKSSKTITASNVSQKVTTLSVDLDGKLMKNIVINLLTTLKDDEECRKIFEAYGDALGVDEDDIEDAWDDIDDTIEYIEDEDDDYYDLDTKLTILVNGKGEIIGLELQGDDFEFSSLTAERGNKFGTEIKVKVAGDTVRIEGNGTKSGNKRTGQFTVKAAGMSILDFEIKNLDMKLLKNGIFNGLVTLRLPEDAIDLIESQAYGDVSFSALEDISLTISSKTQSQKEANCTFAINYEDKPCGTIVITSKRESATSVKTPSDYADTDDNESLLSWVEDFDWSELSDRIDDAGAPSDIVNRIDYIEEALISDLEWQIDYDNGYYYDDDDDYYYYDDDDDDDYYYYYD